MISSAIYFIDGWMRMNLRFDARDQDADTERLAEQCIDDAAKLGISSGELEENLGTGVPVENEGGSGTAGSHWDEQALTNELMTGYINNDGNPVTTNDNVLSDVTIASLGDLGYITILGATYMNVA